ncbi:recombinase family protein [Actinomadura violacea]|uniref:Recombinase family protein n=1 Tax=Actinomadura violacea TaxID=2819934 RepID=A0ABS3RXC7_9ACTN|nr:recombinase family protein [Actinomadura violacea]MBO2461118.1 recombinase family protein [Actinomadura violacea]
MTARSRHRAEESTADAAVRAAGDVRLRAAIYARVSKDMRNGRSVAQQEVEGRAHVARESWDLVGVWVDNDRGASQWSKGKREHWEDLKDQVAAGEVDVLVVWEPSRLTRDRLVWATLAAICEREGVKIAASGRLYDLSDPDDAFQLDLYFALATREVGVTRKRVMRDTKAQAEKGHPHGGIAYGYYRLYEETTGNLIKQVPDYRRRLNVWGVNFVLWLAVVGHPDQWCTPLGRWALGYRVWDAAGTAMPQRKRRPPWWALGPLFTPDNHRIEWYTRADIVTDVVVPRSLAGDPEFAICRELTERGILTSALSGWEPVTLRYLLANPTYAGYRRYRGQLYPAKWAPLVTLEDHQALAGKYGRGTWEGKKPSAVSREHTVKYLLSGLLTCGVCEGPCNTAWTGTGERRRRYYTCIGRGRLPGRSHCTARPLAEIDLYVTELVIEWLSSPEAAEVMMVDTRSAVDLRNLMDRQEDLTTRLDQLYENAGLNGMSDELLAATERNLKAQLDSISDQIKAGQRFPVLRDLVKPDRADVEAAWDRLADNLPRRREVIRTLFTRLELQKVGRGRRYIPIEDSIKVTWREFDKAA